jgi:hypothetical protein
MSELGEAIEKAIENAVNVAVGQHEGGFVTKWLALIESVSPEGERGLWTLSSDDLMAWDTKGMLHHALDLVDGRDGG